MSRRSARLLLVVAALATVTLEAACGAGSKTPGNAVQAVDCDVSGAGTVTVNVLAYNSSATDPFSNAMVKSCSKDGVTVKHGPIDFGGQYQKTATTLAGGQATYDVIEMYSGAIPRYASTGKLTPLNDLVAKYSDQYKLSELNPTMLAGMSYQGKLYALPTMANIGTMVYRKDIFDQLGIAAPQTYADLLSDAKAIQAAGTIKYPVALPLADNTSTLYEQLMSAQGAGYVASGSTKPTFGSPEAKTALQTLADLRPVMDPQVTAFDQTRVQQQLINGKAAIAIMFSGRMADVVNPKLSPKATSFAFAPPPKVSSGGKIGSTVSVDGWSIPTNTKVDPDLLFRMMASSVSADASKQAIPAAYPARQGVADDQNLPYGAAVKASLAGGAVTPPMETWLGNMQNATSPILLNAIIGKLSVGAALNQCQSAAVDALKS